jgi:hypothetical protein
MTNALARHTDAEQQLEFRGDRVREHTSPAVNHRIDLMTRARADEAIAQGGSALSSRLEELDREWDIDRALITNFAIVGGAAFLTGLTRYAASPPFLPKRKGWLYFFGAQLGFLLLHGTVGWCPPLPVMRRLGVRTPREIEAERRMLLEAQALEAA